MNNLWICFDQCSDLLKIITLYHQSNVMIIDDTLMILKSVEHIENVDEYWYCHGNLWYQIIWYDTCMRPTIWTYGLILFDIRKTDNEDK